MATVHIAFRAVHSIGGTAIYTKSPRVAETLTSSASSQQTTITGKLGEVACITVSGGAVYVAVGANPTAVTDFGDMIADGGRLELGILSDLDKVAIKDI